MAGHALVFSGPARLANVLPQELPIGTFPFSLGRAATADGQLQATPKLLGLGSQTDAIISRAHAVLEATADGLRVRDLGSVNGTWVRPQRSDGAQGGGRGRIRLGKDGVAEHALSVGDQISIGNKLVRYTLVRVGGEAPAQPAPRSAAAAAQLSPSTVECPWALQGLAGAVCWVRHARVTIGRGERADFIVTGGDSFMQTSRVHCALVVTEDQQLHVEDLGSVNGTHVDDERLQPRQPRVLRGGMRLVLGRSQTPELTFVVTPSSQAKEGASMGAGSPVRMLDDDLSPEGVPPLPRKAALPPMRRLRAGVELRESQSQQHEEKEEEVLAGSEDIVQDNELLAEESPAAAAAASPAVSAAPAGTSPMSVDAADRAAAASPTMEAESRSERKRQREQETSPMGAAAKVPRSQADRRYQAELLHTPCPRPGAGRQVLFLG